MDFVDADAQFGGQVGETFELGIVVGVLQDGDELQSSTTLRDRKLPRGAELPQLVDCAAKLSVTPFVFVVVDYL